MPGGGGWHRPVPCSPHHPLAVCWLPWLPLHLSPHMERLVAWKTSWKKKRRRREKRREKEKDEGEWALFTGWYNRSTTGVTWGWQHKVWMFSSPSSWKLLDNLNKLTSPYLLPVCSRLFAKSHSAHQPVPLVFLPLSLELHRISPSVGWWAPSSLADLQTHSQVLQYVYHGGHSTFRVP